MARRCTIARTWVGRLGVVVVALTVSCSADGTRCGAETERAIRAYGEGAAEAVREIRAGGPTIYQWGMDPRGGTDPETGLPRKVVASDAVGPETLWRIRGHNDAVRAYVGLPAGDAEGTR